MENSYFINIYLLIYTHTIKIANNIERNIYFIKVADLEIIDN